MAKWMMMIVLLAAGCGTMDDRENRTLAQGYTPCNDFPDPESGVICHPNQYCASQRLNWCHTGCLSDDNCSHEQICVKSHAAHTGQCTDVETLPDPDPDLDPGYTQCGDPRDPNHYEICQPSHYCYSYYFGDCSLGCVSDDNCTGDQTCVKKPDEDVGSCQAVR